MRRALAVIGLSAVGFSLSACDSQKPKERSAPVVALTASAAPAEQQAAPVAPQPSPAPSAGPCTALCAHTASLSCGSLAQCRAGCAEMFGQKGCDAALAGFARCLTAEPLAHWECTEGAPAIKDGYCDAEQRELSTCLGQHAGNTP
jgi:hypothetical protein